MKPFLTILPIALLLACQSKTNSSSASGETADNTASATGPAISCYQSMTGQDTAQLRIESTAYAATGMLAYMRHEKEKTSGHINGKMYGDTLIADYHYMAAGTRSMRQVAFLLSGDEAIEGYGPQSDVHGKMIFNSRKEISYGTGVNMQKTDCNEVRIKAALPLTNLQQGLKGSWRLEHITGTQTAIDKLYPDKKPELIFVTLQPVEFTGNSGCNNIHGACKVNASSIQFDEPITMTKMACPGSGEQIFLDLLKKVTRFSVREGKLILQRDDMEVMRFTRV